MATKVGIIGAGGMVSYHIQGFKQAGAEIAAIADVNEEATQKVADENAIPNSTAVELDSTGRYWFKGNEEV
mgnify:CR=1 FL=1